MNYYYCINIKLYLNSMDLNYKTRFKYNVYIISCCNTTFESNALCSKGSNICNVSTKL